MIHCYEAPIRRGNATLDRIIYMYMDYGIVIDGEREY